MFSSLFGSKSTESDKNLYREILFTLKNRTERHEDNSSKALSLIKTIPDKSMPKFLKFLDYGILDGAMASAAKHGHIDVLKELLARGAPVDHNPNKDKRTPLHLAAGTGNLEIVRLLLAHGANKDARDTGGNTALHFAAANEKSPSVVQYLLQSGFDKHALNNEGRSPMYLAAADPYCDNITTVKFLLEAGCLLDEKDKNGRTLLYRAAWNGRLGVVAYLAACGANLHVVNADHRTLMHSAAMGGTRAEFMVQFLILEGVDKTIKDDNGNTAADLCRADVKPTFNYTQKSPHPRWYQDVKAHAALAAADTRRVLRNRISGAPDYGTDSVSNWPSADIIDERTRDLGSYQSQLGCTKTQPVERGKPVDLSIADADDQTGVSVTSATNASVAPPAARVAAAAADSGGLSISTWSNDDDFSVPPVPSTTRAAPVAKSAATTKLSSNSASVPTALRPPEDTLKELQDRLQRLNGETVTKPTAPQQTQSPVSTPPVASPPIASSKAHIPGTPSPAPSPAPNVSPATPERVVTFTAAEGAALRAQLTRFQQAISSHSAPGSAFFAASGQRVDPRFVLSPQAHAEKTFIDSHTDLHEYYLTIQRLFNEAFAVSVILKSDKFSTATTTPASVLSALGSVLGDVPFAGLVFSAASSAAQSYGDARSAGRYLSLSHLNPASDPIHASLMSELVARKLALLAAARIRTGAFKAPGSPALKAIRTFLNKAEAATRHMATQTVGKQVTTGWLGEERSSYSAVKLLAMGDGKYVLEYVLSGQLEKALTSSAHIVGVARGACPVQMYQSAAQTVEAREHLVLVLVEGATQLCLADVPIAAVRSPTSTAAPLSSSASATDAFSPTVDARPFKATPSSPLSPLPSPAVSETISWANFADFSSAPPLTPPAPPISPVTPTSPSLDSFAAKSELEQMREQMMEMMRNQTALQQQLDKTTAALHQEKQNRSALNDIFQTATGRQIQVNALSAEAAKEAFQAYSQGNTSFHQRMQGMVGATAEEVELMKEQLRILQENVQFKH